MTKNELFDLALNVHRLCSLAADDNFRSQIPNLEQFLDRKLGAEVEALRVELRRKYGIAPKLEWLVDCTDGGVLGGFKSKEEAEAWASEHPDVALRVFCGPDE